MISYDYQCIFIHIPKNGGSSIEDMLWPTSLERTEKTLWMGLIDRYRNKYQTGGLQHLLANQIRQEVGQENFDRFFKFSLVRNPWDKAVSQYAYMKRRPDLRKWVGMRRWTSFKQYLELIQSRKHVQWEEQYRFLFDDDGNQLVDFIGRFEDFDAEVERILKKIVEKTGRLELAHLQVPHANKSLRAAYQTYYDSESQAMVRAIYQRDIELFNYRF